MCPVNTLTSSSNEMECEVIYQYDNTILDSTTINSNSKIGCLRKDDDKKRYHSLCFTKYDAKEVAKELHHEMKKYIQVDIEDKTKSKMLNPDWVSNSIWKIITCNI